MDKQREIGIKHFPLCALEWHYSCNKGIGTKESLYTALRSYLRIIIKSLESLYRLIHYWVERFSGCIAPILFIQLPHLFLCIDIGLFYLHQQLIQFIGICFFREDCGLIEPLERFLYIVSIVSEIQYKGITFLRMATIQTG